MITKVKDIVKKIICYSSLTKLFSYIALILES